MSLEGDKEGQHTFEMKALELGKNTKHLVLVGQMGKSSPITIENKERKGHHIGSGPRPRKEPMLDSSLRDRSF